MAIEFAGADTSDSGLTAITSGTAGSKGGYTELISSTARESHLISVFIMPTSQDYEGVLHLATGADESEVDFLDVPFHGNEDEVHRFTVPFTVASSARVAAAMTSTDASATADVAIALSDDDSWGTCTEATLIGSSGGQGTDIDPGTPANTKPTNWTELTSSTPHDFDMLLINMGYSNNNAIGSRATWLVDIGTGASMSETALLENIPYKEQGFEIGHCPFVVYAPISSGTRVSARCQSSETDATDRIIDVSIVGFNLTAPAGGGGGGSESFGGFVS